MQGTRVRHNETWQMGCGFADTWRDWKLRNRQQYIRKRSNEQLSPKFPILPSSMLSGHSAERQADVHSAYEHFMSVLYSLDACRALVKYEECR